MANLGPVIWENLIRFLSVSQLEKFDRGVYGGCARRWWLRYVGRLKEPERAAPKLGTQVHAQIEHHLKKGDAVLGDVAGSGKRFIPKWGSDLLVEYEFGRLDESPELTSARALIAEHDVKWYDEGRTTIYTKKGADTGWVTAIPTEIQRAALAMPTGPLVSPLLAGGVPLIGKIDLLHARGYHLDDEGERRDEDGRVAEALDWKTTKSIEAFAKSGADLGKTWQMTGYGVIALGLWPDLDAVRLSHGYFQTQGPRLAVKRTVVVPADEIRARWALTDGLVASMRQVAAETDVKKVEPCYEACDAYGGCPYRGPECPRDARLVLAAMLKRPAKSTETEKVKGADQMESLLDRMRAKQASGTVGVPAERPAAPTPAKPAEAPAQMTMMTGTKTEEQAERDALLAEEAALSGRVTPADAPRPSEIAKPIPAEAAVSQEIRAAAEAAMPAAPAEAQPDGKCPTRDLKPLDADACVAKKFTCPCGAVVKVKPVKMGDGKWYAKVPVHDAPKAPEKPAEPTPTPVENKVEFKGEPMISSKPSQQTPEATDKALEAAIRVETHETEKIVLYIDCYPDDAAGLIRLDPYAQRLAADLAATCGAVGVRCAPERSALAFGKWKDAIQASAREALPPPGRYLVDSSDEVVMEVARALVPFAVVTRGVK